MDSPVAAVIAIFTAIVLFIVLIMGCIAGFGAFGRWQSRSDAHNRATNAITAANNKVAVTKIEIQNQDQMVKVTEQQADIRFQQAVGIRKAQDEISKTLTPLYVQMQMVDTLQAIAKSGKNNTVIYVPAGEGGIPTITAQAGTGK
jgi:hypothetical protein